MDKNWQFLIDLDIFAKFDAFVCHGTLLGLIRDGDLIQWDQDIDLAVFEEDFDKADVVDLFCRHGFTCLDYGKGYDYITFQRDGGRNVDINIYRRVDGGRATLWKVPKTKLVATLLFMTHAGRLIRHHKMLVRALVIFTPVCKLLDQLFGTHRWLFERKGYFIDAQFLGPERFITFDCETAYQIPVPFRSEELLESTYGSDWRVPKKDYDWEVEALSVHVQ